MKLFLWDDTSSNNNNNNILCDNNTSSKKVNNFNVIIPKLGTFPFPEINLNGDDNIHT